MGQSGITDHHVNVSQKLAEQPGGLEQTTERLPSRAIEDSKEAPL